MNIYSRKCEGILALTVQPGSLDLGLSCCQAICHQTFGLCNLSRQILGPGAKACLAAGMPRKGTSMLCYTTSLPAEQHHLAFCFSYGMSQCEQEAPPADACGKAGGAGQRTAGVAPWQAAQEPRSA